MRPTHRPPSRAASRDSRLSLARAGFGDCDRESRASMAASLDAGVRGIVLLPRDAPARACRAACACCGPTIRFPQRQGIAATARSWNRVRALEGGQRLLYSFPAVPLRFLKFPHPSRRGRCHRSLSAAARLRCADPRVERRKACALRRERRRPSACDRRGHTDTRHLGCLRVTIPPRSAPGRPCEGRVA